MYRIAVIAITTFTMARPAAAGVFIGNPNLGFRVDRQQGDYVEGVVTLEKVRVGICTGGYIDYPVDKVVDPVAGYSIQIQGGNLCSATWYWDSALDVDGSGVQGDYTVRYSGATTGVALSENIDWINLNPWSVVWGTMSGGGPKLLTWIE